MLLRFHLFLLLAIAPLCAESPRAYEVFDASGRAKMVSLKSVLGQTASEFDDEEPLNLRRARPDHGSETERYRSTGIGDYGITWAFFYTARSYNVTSIKGRDESFSGQYITSMDFAGLGALASIEYRIAPEWMFNFTPRVDAAYGILNRPRHHSHELQKLNFTRNYRGKDDQQKFSMHMRFEFAARWRYLWFVQDFELFWSFRRSNIKSYDRDYEDPQLGKIDLIGDRERVDYDHIQLFGTGTGIGLEWWMLDEDYRLVSLILYRPFNSLSFRRGKALTHGLEIILRSSPFSISNQVGLFYELSCQLFLNVDGEFNRAFYTQFSIGLRFR